MSVTIWIIGMFFLIGFTRVKFSGFWDRILISILWPIQLGDEIRSLIEERRKP